MNFDNLNAEVDAMHIIIGLKDRIKNLLREAYDSGWSDGYRDGEDDCRDWDE